MIITILLLIIGLFILTFNSKPQNSLELYSYILSSKDYNKASEISLEGYEDNFTIEDYEEILKESPEKIRQFTLLQYDFKTSTLIETTPGTQKIKVLRVKKLPIETSDFFKENDER